MSLGDAKRALQWNVVTEALAAAEVDAEVIELVEHARAVNEIIQSMTSMLLSCSDSKQVKNYIKVEMTGMLPPFERAYIELIRPSGKTSHELRNLLRDRLTHVRYLLSKGQPTDGLREGIIQGIDEDLATEAP